MACRINRRRGWAGRILLESMGYPASYFVTLTYAPPFLPLADGRVPTLFKPDLQNFCKRLRKRFSFRYFACGEYGETRGRPHYHLILFTNEPGMAVAKGVDEAWAMTSEDLKKREWLREITPVQRKRISQGTVKKPSRTRRSYLITRQGELSGDGPPSWDGRLSCGRVDIGLLNENRAEYVAKYTVKKLTSERSYSDGRAPEFATMSRKPGIGHGQIEALSQALANTTFCSRKGFHGYDSILKILTVTSMLRGSFKYGSREYPFDRYSQESIMRAHGLDVNCSSFTQWVNMRFEAWRQDTVEDAAAVAEKRERTLRSIEKGQRRYASNRYKNSAAKL